MKEYKDAFELITDDPAKLRILKAKSALMDEVVSMIRYKIDTCEWTQSDVAVMLGVKQPRISRLLNGGFGEFSFEMLTQFKYGLE